MHFIKCDVEGHELEVLQGGQRVLREDRPVLLVECVDSRPEVGQTDRVFPYLEALGYRGYFFPNGRTESLTRFRVEHHQVAPDAEWLVNFASSRRNGSEWAEAASNERPLGVRSNGSAASGEEAVDVHELGIEHRGAGRTSHGVVTERHELVVEDRART